MKLSIHNTFTSLPADTKAENFIRKVDHACYSFVTPTKTAKPSLIHTSKNVAALVGIDKCDFNSKEFLEIFSGNAVYDETTPYAMCYGGHQFGNWAGQLGDGRAINLFEVNHNTKQWALQLKGAGKTPYSRNADGLAVLRSSIREYLCSEAMHHLGVPTTRALSLALTGDYVLRDVLYNGNAAYEKGAIVCRVAPSFVRFGNFEILAAQNDLETLKKLTDYCIAELYPEIDLSLGKDAYLQFYKHVVSKTLHLMIEWHRVGFVHGVMNTDNMSILGLTIDYGPYGWLEDYNPGWTPNTTDASHKRYRFGNQIQIGLWNLVQLGNALFPLINDLKAMEEILESYEVDYNVQFNKMMLSKLGLSRSTNETTSLISNLQAVLEKSEMDMTLFYRNLSQFNGNDLDSFLMLLPSLSYASNFDIHIADWTTWLTSYSNCILIDKNNNRIESMNAVNPKYVLRNYMAQLAIEAAEKEDYSLIDELYQLLEKPYDEQPKMAKWFAKRPDWAKEKIGSSQLSCSS